jgi:hypothetical protein
MIFTAATKPFGKWSEGLQFEERGDTLHMRSVYNAYPFGLVWVAALVAGLVINSRSGAVDLSSFGDVVGVGVLGLAGLVLLTIRSIDTSFDSANRTIFYRRSFFFVVWHRRCFSFAETSGVVFKLDVDDGGRCWLYLVLKDGSRRLLAYESGSAACERAFEAIHAATGLTKISDA